MQTLVVTEVSHLLASRLGVEAQVRFVGDLAAGNLIAEAVAVADWIHIAELVTRYRHLPLRAVDASVVAAANGATFGELAPSTADTSPSSNRRSARSRFYRDVAGVTLRRGRRPSSCARGHSFPEEVG